MIAPDPAPAGSRPAAPPRDLARAAESERPSGGDFDSVLKEPAPEKAGEHASGKGEGAAPSLDAAPPAPPAPEASMALAGLVPAAATLPEEACSVTEAVVAAMAALPVARGVVLAAEPGAAAHGAAIAPPPERIESAEVAEAPEVEAKVAAAPARDRVAPPAAAIHAGAVPAAEAEQSSEADEERPVSEGPRREAPAGEATRREAPAAPAAPAAAPAGGDGGQGLTVREGAPPTWHLVTDAGPGPTRLEAAAQVQAQAQVHAVPPQAVAGQVAVAIGRASDEKLEIRLDPPELGRVQIHLVRHDGGIQAMVMADRPETQDLLRRHADVLVRELGQAGYDSVSLDFAGGEARAGRDDGRGLDWAEAAASPAAAAGAVVSAAVPRRSAMGGLDVRL